MNVNVKFNLNADFVIDMIALYIACKEKDFKFKKSEFKNYLKIQLELFGVDAQFGENFFNDYKKERMIARDIFLDKFKKEFQ